MLGRRWNGFVLEVYWIKEGKNTSDNVYYKMLNKWKMVNESLPLNRQHAIFCFLAPYGHLQGFLDVLMHFGVNHHAVLITQLVFYGMDYNKPVTTPLYFWP